MEFYHQWIMLTIVFGVALVSPGPDFVMSVRNSILHGRKAGIVTAAGFGFSVFIHIVYTLAGLGRDHFPVRHIVQYHQICRCRLPFLYGIQSHSLKRL